MEVCTFKIPSIKEGLNHNLKRGRWTNKLESLLANSILRITLVVSNLPMVITSTGGQSL